MNLQPSTPAATAYRPLALSAFENTNLTFVSHKPVTSAPDFGVPTTFSDATPTEWGQQTNKSIVYHYSAKAKDLSQYAPGAVIFMFRSPRLLGLECPDRSKRVADIFKLNAWFKEISEGHGNKKYADLLLTSEQVMSHISFAGVLKNTITNSSRERNLGTSVMNNVVGERASTVNLWGNAAREGTPLYLLLIRKDGAWKFVPYAGHGPPLKALMYEEKGSLRVGDSIFVGTAISSPTVTVEGNQNILEDPERAKRLQAWVGGVDICIGV